MYLSDMETEYSSIQNFSPKECSSILDIGCGVAGIDIFLNQHYLHQKVDFFLLDKTQIYRNVYCMFEENGVFYNSLN